MSNNRKEQGFLLVEIRIDIQGIDSHWKTMFLNYSSTMQMLEGGKVSREIIDI
jgi:hypothetical protein